ncbi:hypothetical protein GCM10010140_60450 [Streptosporangium pseudovulgare]|uniref:Uncharacterized protein n=1 Tax=Streptosporangium pseudovulgare TaxID=35765 RepID=A0ABQ2RCH1_9ACTN|nr:hypothetical protein GCM10010140_60450 [Streptosporangium pseudovulgare]
MCARITARTWRDKSGAIAVTGAFPQAGLLDIKLYVNRLSLPAVLGLWAAHSYFAAGGTNPSGGPLSSGPGKSRSSCGADDLVAEDGREGFADQAVQSRRAS